MRHLRFNNVRFRQGNWECHFDGSFAPHEWTVVCGPSGSGKSTLLQLAIGLLPLTSGDIMLGDKSISAIAPHLRGMGYMGQSNMLFPSVPILENLLLALEHSRESTSSKRQLIESVTTSFGLDPRLLKAYPDQLSGGQLSRCNLARAILKSENWLLLDEPFAAIDRVTRLHILSWLKDWQASRKIGILLVAHDLHDVFAMASNIAIIEHGKIADTNSVDKLIRHPSKIISARLFGAGIILSQNDTATFVPSEFIKVSRVDVEGSVDDIGSIELSNARVFQSGGILRILDLNHDCDISIASHKPFQGTLWFNRAHCQHLDP